MKRTAAFFVTVLFLLCAKPLVCQTDYKSLVFSDIEGSYAIYRTSGFGETAYIGLAARGGNSLVLRLYLAESGTEVIVSHTFYTVGAELEPGTLTVLRGDLMASDATRRFLPTVYGWMRAWLVSRARFEEMPEYDLAEDGSYHFQYWIPVLQMEWSKDAEGMDGAGGTDGATLVTAGIMTSALDPAFYGYEGEPEIVDGPDFRISPGESASILLDGLSIPLDSNWRGGPDGVYRIARVTEQDAAFTVEALDLAEFGNSDTFDMIKLFVLYSGGVLLPEGLRIFVYDECPCLFYRVWDAERKQVTVQYKLFVPRDGTVLSVASLSTFESLYDGNKDYFDGILF